MPINKIELESQVLCAALRQSWSSRDAAGALTAARELYQLFPDLLPGLKQGPQKQILNYYDVLGLKSQATPDMAAAAYLKAAREFLLRRQVKEEKEAYNRLLDAGFILRKPRLRLSHDLVMARRWLMQVRAIPEDGMLDLPASACEPPAEQLSKTQPLACEMPCLMQLLKESQFIGPSEIQALTAQMAIAPEIPLERLVLNAGYLTESEMNSLKLAETLLDQGKISMAQFQVAIYDERTSGIRMAESLQVRGWLPTETSGQAGA